MKIFSIDVFSGVGGLTEGMRKAGFITKIAFEYDKISSDNYKINHPDTFVITKDIRLVSTDEIRRVLGEDQIHLLAGCPPCQGFSAMRRLNRLIPIEDDRNSLIMDYVRLVKELKPLTIMMENVPALINYNLFNQAIDALMKEGYWIDFDVVNVKDYGVPQNRKRLVMIGSRLGDIKIAKPTNKATTVRQAIGSLPNPKDSKDPIHKIFPTHTLNVQTRIELTPKNGGSWKDLPKKYMLECHRPENVGFNDVYGRLSWDNASSTITGGCLNPSKGRFLHPEQNRCISAREAAILQTFPKKYKFIKDTPITKLALMIGNALPPKFSHIQSKNIMKHIINHLS